MSEKLKKGWTRTAFGEMVEHIAERVEPTPEDSKNFIGLEHLDSGSLTIRRWGSDIPLIGTKLRMRKGDILFARRNAYLRRVAVAPHDGLFSAHGMIVRARPSVIMPDFLPFFMQSDVFMERAEQISVGSLSPTINWKTLAKEEFTLPPLEEQRRIEGLLKTLRSTISQLEELKQVSSILLKSTGNHLFGNILNDQKVPKRNLGELASSKVTNGIFRTHDQFGNGIRLINVTDCYKAFRVNLSELERVPVSDNEYESYSAKPGDVIFNRSSLVRSGIGHACLVPESEEKIVFECHLMRVRPNTEILFGPFLARYSLSPVGRNYILSKAQTTTMTTIDQRTLQDMPIPCPNIKAQIEIANSLDEIDKSINLINKRLLKQYSLSSRIVNSLLGV